MNIEDKSKEDYKRNEIDEDKQRRLKDVSNLDIFSLLDLLIDMVLIQRKKQKL